MSHGRTGGCGVAGAVGAAATVLHRLCYLMRQSIHVKWQRHMLVLYGRISQLMLLMHACLRYVLKIKGLMYTVNHKKRDILFLTITLANLNRFL